MCYAYYMARPILTPYPDAATIEELKAVSRIGSNETSTRCTAIQMLLAGATRELVCQANEIAELIDHQDRAAEDLDHLTLYEGIQAGG